MYPEQVCFEGTHNLVYPFSVLIALLFLSGFPLVVWAAGLHALFKLTGARINSVRAALGWLFVPAGRPIGGRQPVVAPEHLLGCAYLAPFLVEAYHPSYFRVQLCNNFRRCCWRAHPGPWPAGEHLGRDGPSSRNVGLSRLRQRWPWPYFTAGVQTFLL
jgi:hypothetical protein